MQANTVLFILGWLEGLLTYLGKWSLSRLSRSQNQVKQTKAKELIYEKLIRYSEQKIDCQPKLPHCYNVAKTTTDQLRRKLYMSRETVYIAWVQITIVHCYGVMNESTPDMLTTSMRLPQCCFDVGAWFLLPSRGDSTPLGGGGPIRPLTDLHTLPSQAWSGSPVS